MKLQPLSKRLLIPFRMHCRFQKQAQVVDAGDAIYASLDRRPASRINSDEVVDRACRIGKSINNLPDTESLSIFSLSSIPVI
jgi:hypothetical protein